MFTSSGDSLRTTPRLVTRGAGNDGGVGRDGIGQAGVDRRRRAGVADGDDVLERVAGIDHAVRGGIDDQVDALLHVEDAAPPCRPGRSRRSWSADCRRSGRRSTSERTGETPSADAVAWLTNVSSVGLPFRSISGSITCTPKVATTNSPGASDGMEMATLWPVTSMVEPLPVMLGGPRRAALAGGSVVLRPAGTVSLATTFWSVVGPRLVKMSVYAHDVAGVHRAERRHEVVGQRHHLLHVERALGPARRADDDVGGLIAVGLDAVPVGGLGDGGAGIDAALVADHRAVRDAGVHRHAERDRDRLADPQRADGHLERRRAGLVGRARAWW